MKKTIVEESVQELNSVEISRNAKGDYSYTVKVYDADEKVAQYRAFELLKKTETDISGYQGAPHSQ